MSGLLMASGGIDSTVLMYQLHRQDRLSAVFFCDYGQASAHHQQKIISYHTSRLGLPWHLEKFYWPEYDQGGGFVFREGHYPAPMEDAYELLDMSDEEKQRSLEDKWGFLQGRNVIWLTLACSYAINNGINTVYTAFQFDDPEWESIGEDGWAASDQGPGFVAAFNHLAKMGAFTRPVSVECPFLNKRRSKQEIVALGRWLDVPLENTYSCEFFPECGKCHQCLIRKDVLRID